MKLSIIIPIYNVEKLMGRCLDSILTQQFTDYELLLIDDGSPDRSGEIADEYATKDKRIKVFHKKNGGQSDARNFGIEHAKGEYIMFVDSDDEIAKGTIAPLISKMEADKSIDILEFPVLERPGTTTEHLFNTGEHTFADAMEWLASNGFEHSWPWNKVYKKSLFNDIRFEKGKIFEDVILIKDILRLQPRITSTGKGLYLYHWNENGTVGISKKKNLLPLLEAQLATVESLKIDTTEKRWHRLYLGMLTTQMYVYQQTGKLMLRGQHLSVRKYNSWNDCVKAVMLNTLGIKNTCRLFTWIRKP